MLLMMLNIHQIPSNFDFDFFFLIFINFFALFSRMIASASFDKSVRLWRALDGKFICAFRGHVQAVYTVAWSADSRLICSGSKDSTLKVWSVDTKKLAQELPGHADEVFGVDWAPDGSRVASGGKDKIIKLWAY